jgi:hypothetical protein
LTISSIWWAFKRRTFLLQSSEGGSFTVGTRKFRITRSVTPPLTPVSARPLEGVPVTMPANLLTERMPPRARLSRFSTLAAATDKIVISRNVLIGLCLTTFAFGIVTTLVIDHVHSRASEVLAPREPEPSVLQTTAIDPEAKPSVAAAAAAAPSLPSSALPSSIPSSVPASPPAAPTASPAVQPQAAAAEAVVVQLPPIAERSAQKAAVHPHLSPPAPSRGVHQVAVAAVRTRRPPATTRNRTSATVQGGPSRSATETAPAEHRVTPARTKTKWVDPFDQ